MSRFLLAIAVLPTLVIFAIVIKNARAKREPVKKVAKVFGISVASTILAMILELIGEAILGSIFDAAGGDSESVLGVLLNCLFVIALVEEGCKYFTFKIMIFNDREFDNTYDGIIYGAASALGFATLENILYVAGGGIGTGILRAVLSVPLHACTGIFMGYYFGISKYKKYNDINQDKNPQRRAYIIAVIIHALYDFFLMAEGATDAPENFIYITIGAVLIIMIIVYLIMIFTIRKGRLEDQPIYNRYYYERLNGAYQDMRGTTSEKMTGSSPMPMMPPNMAQPYGQPMNGQMNRPMNMPYGQPVPMSPNVPPPFGAPNAPMYGVQPNIGGYGMNNGYNMNNAYAANRNMPGGNYPPQNGYGRPVPPNNGYVTPTPQPVPDRSPASPQNAYATQAKEPTVQPRIHYCNECGNRLEGDVSVCPVCGNKI